MIDLDTDDVLRELDELGVDWADVGKQAFGGLHTAGTAVLSVFGAREAAKQLEALENKAGILPSWAKNAAGSQTPLQAQPQAAQQVQPQIKPQAAQQPQVQPQTKQVEEQKKSSFSRGLIPAGIGLGVIGLIYLLVRK